MTPETLVSTGLGKLKGVRDDKTGICIFRGIPYAESPVGELRFKPTVPKKPWDGVLDANRFGPSGPQVFDPTEGSYSEFTDDPPQEGKLWVGSEDNLVLNIWTPEVDSKKRPVMVWIHGGANWLESSRLATYHGDRFVERGDVVFVSINYRLGVFGFLDVSVLGGGAYKGSHSNGLNDQITALKWIKEHIAGFGGDPENITVMGESAGSIDTSWLLTSGHLDGIAKRVVLMSGVAGLIGLSGNLTQGFTEQYAQEQARTFLSYLGITSMEEILRLSTAQIMEKVVHTKQTRDMLYVMDSQFWPRVIPDILPEDPFRAARKRGNRGIDVMIGYTSYEMGLWLFWDDKLDQIPCIEPAKRIQDFAKPGIAESAVKAYTEYFPQETDGVRGMHMLGDAIFVMPSLWFADEIAQHGGNIWMYQFDRETNNRQRALHAADQAYMFNKLETHAAKQLLGIPRDNQEKTTREKLSYAMQDAVLAFVRNGDPNAHDNALLPHWPLYRVEERSVMSFDNACQIIKDPAAARRKWWYENIYKPALG